MRAPRDKSLTTLGLLALAATLVLLAVPALTAAHAGQAAATAGAGHEAMFEAHLQRMAQKLNLTEEQQATAKQLFQDMKAKVAPIHQAQQALHTQLKAALAVANPDAATVGQAVIQMHQNRAQLKPVMQAFHQQLEALLTPDQLAKFKQMQAAHPAFGHHRGVGTDPSQ
ncbi:MAG TPA: periplasmic heavy metal sensor [Thermoanaerobaculia bacterium]